MKILHGTWIPEASYEFIQTGNFYLWIETSTPKNRKNQPANRHRGQLAKEELALFLANELGLVCSSNSPTSREITSKYFLLPSANQQPLPSLELSRYLELELPETSDLQSWEIDCYRVTPVIKILNDLHFISLNHSLEIQMGSDLLFWYYYTQAFKQIILKDQYIPAFKYREISTQIRKSKPKSHSFEIYTIWEIVSEAYEANLKRYLNYLPLVCLAGAETAHPRQEFYDPETLLRHFSEALLNFIVTSNPTPASFDKKINETALLYGCLHPKTSQQPWTNVSALEDYRKWQTWKQKLLDTQNTSTFHLCFKLHEASENNLDHWQIQFLVASKQDPSLKLELDDYWFLSQKTKKPIQKHFGNDFEKNLLLNLAYAARMYPLIWKGLETHKPSGFSLTLAEAFDFLKESAWILEDAGYKVIIPAWWTPEGRQRAKIRLQASSKKSSAKSLNQGYFNLETIIQYQYELSIGGQIISQEEWQQLVQAKTPLVQFRGQWIELDQNKMKQMLEFWQAHQEEHPEMTLLELMKKATEEADEIEVEPDQMLAAMMAQLRDPSYLEPIENPTQLQGNLREYQKRGVAWIQYLERLGINGCLADDMGLGKSLQVIARLITERETNHPILPTLLIAPTSVVGNWQKEIEKFAPHLKSFIHHGSSRYQDETEFQSASLEHDLVITSFTLARKDAKLFNSLTWQRIVIDEAQNLKNPKAAQTKAILTLQANHRLALTGTPIENRLLDLWSIFNFLNPGYLGKEAQFRKTFEIPIQKQNDQVQSNVLKKLVEPLILRRVKTDKQIIKDLPDKIEHKQYCNLTKEQASLYEAVVKNVEEQLQDAEGIQRKGLIVSTLMKLKQICNHPRQFLQDSSEFTPARSHKLSRLGEMLEEVIAEEESFLIFTQFTEIGEALHHYLKQTFHYNTYYLHGGTTRQKREKMIAEFQAPETEPSAFILSLKAGGVGITLTKANHVFHFDRWWNPAVENQATDRAFRIGQSKNVFVHKFVTLGTLEERIDEMIEEKKKIANSIVGADESWLTELDNESFRKLIALNRQAII
ncbi:ATP-dependent helicase [Aphanothece hegewaldii CCALA 016]|uniref:ATP-dependent helicase n=1 Tax=Aphanothece hegewaldii CCALA 016 TaxID=2107694 RepID=A0A2T1LR56_9CHRO|nr:DEAD/DEAH box helicase [Aphanothece hegewaldii]PSF30498.1 ATP-dependent helicase [Aphanothece hegewaldii CCALA 016]